MGTAMLSLSAFLAACGGCGPDDEDLNKCDGIVCELGECSANSGLCENVAMCTEQDQCLNGFTCEQGTCLPGIACNDVDMPCSRGVCASGACVDKDECVVESDCLGGKVCEAGVCEENVCDSGKLTCERGVCSVDAAACVNKEVCAAATEAEDCVDGFSCYGQSCVSEEELCEALDCERSGGVCSVADKACINADDCAGDDGQCLDGFFCDTDDDTCKENKCDTNMVMCDRGECERPSGTCVNPDSCAASSACLPGNFCVGNVCTPEAEACSEPCAGTQTCFFEEADLAATCIEDIDAGCTNAIDCVDERVCDSGSCAPPPVCNADAYEPNNNAAAATDFIAQVMGGRASANICVGDVDVYTYDTEQDVDQQGTFVVQLDYVSADVGLGALKAEIVAPSGTVVASGNAVDGKLRLSTNISQVTKGIYSVRVLGADAGVTTAGVRYTLAMDVVDATAITACDMAPVLAADTPQMENSISGDSAALSASCADTQGLNGENIFEIEVAAASYVTITATPADMNTDISVSLRSDCLNNASEVRGACAETAGIGGEEVIKTLLDPGTYFIVVQGPVDMTGGSYTLTWSRQDVVCSPANNGCINATSAQECRPDGTGFDTVSCLQGCDMATGSCSRLDGDLCADANVVDSLTGFVGMIPWGSLQADYSTAAAGCVPTSAGDVSATAGPDVTYSVTLNPNQALSVDLTSNGNDVSLYAIKSCLNVDSSCQAAVNAGSAADERLFYINPGPNPETLIVVADVAQADSYTDSAITIDVLDVICMPTELRCMNGVSETCDATGTGYEDPETCFFGCDMATGDCLNPPNDTCSGAIPLVSGVPVTNTIDDYTNSSPTTSGGCTGFSNNGGDAIYSISAQQGDYVEISLTTDFDGALWVATDCDMTADQVLIGSCLQGSDETFSSGTETVAFLAPTTGDFFVVAQAFSASASGGFELTGTISAPQCTPGQPSTCSTATSLEYCSGVGQLATYTCSTTCTNGACDSPTGDVCADPRVLDPAGGTITNQAFGLVNDVSLPPGASGACNVGSLSETDGEEIIYRIDLLAGDLLSLNLTTTESTARVSVLEDCNLASTCLQRSRQGGGGQVDFFAQAAGTYFVIVDVEEPFFSTLSPFNLSWSVSSGLVCAPGQSFCQDASTIARCDDLGQSILSTSTCASGCMGGVCQVDLATSDTCAAAAVAVDVGAGISVVHDYSDLTDDILMTTPNCTGVETDGPDAFYAVVVPAGSVLTATAQGTSFTTPAVYAISDCAAPEATCVAGARSSNAGAQLNWLNDSPADANLIVAVDSDDDFESGSVRLDISVRPSECAPGVRLCQPAATQGQDDTLRVCNEFGLYDNYTCDGTCGTINAERCDNPAGEICLDALPLRSANDPAATMGTIASTTLLPGSDFTLPPGRSGACYVSTANQTDGAETFYTIDLAAGEVLTVDLTASSSVVNVQIFTGCSASSCADISFGAGSVSYYAETPQEVFVVVDSTTSTTATYSLSWEVESGLSCAPGQTRCLDASTQGVCSADGLSETSLSCGTCEGGLCLADTNLQDTCVSAAAQPLVVGGLSVFASYSDLTNDIDMPSPNCTGWQTDGKDLFYAVEVPAGDVLTARVENYDDSYPLIYFIEDCAAPSATCLVGADVISNRSTEIGYYNDTGMTKTVIVGADNEFSSASGGFGLSISTRPSECTPGTSQCNATNDGLEVCNQLGLIERTPCFFGCDPAATACLPPTNDTCSGALALTSGVTVTGRIEDYTNTDQLPDSTCTGFGTAGGDAIYSIDLQAGDVLDVVMDSTGFDESVWVSDSCDLTTDTVGMCLAGDDNSSSLAENIRIVAATSGTYYIVATTFSTFSPTGSFDLTATISVPDCIPGQPLTCTAGDLQVCNELGFFETIACDASGCNATNDGCANPSGDVCADSIPLIDAQGTGGPSGSAMGNFTGSDSLILPVGQAGGCFLDTSNQSDGADTFYTVSLLAGDLLRLQLTTTYGSAHLYILEECDNTSSCVRNRPRLGSGQLLHYAAQDQTLIVVVDANGASTASFTLDYEVTQGSVCAPDQFRCTGPVDPSTMTQPTLAYCSSDGFSEVIATCDCVNNACVDDVANNDLCGAAAPLVGDAYAMYGDFDDHTSAINIPSSGCAGSAGPGPDAFVQVELLPGQVLHAWVESYGAEEPLVYAFTDCTDAQNTCVKGSDSVSNRAELFYVNSSPNNELLFVAVDSEFSTADEPFGFFIEKIQSECTVGDPTVCDITGTKLQVCNDFGIYEFYDCNGGCDVATNMCVNPTGDICLDTIPVNDLANGSVAGTTFSFTGDFSTLTNAQTNDSATTCGSATFSSNGPDATYVVTLLPGQSLDLTLGSATADTILYITRDCGDDGLSCVAGADDVFSSSPAETLTYTNMSGANETVFVVADTFSTTATGAYTLGVTIN